MAKRTKGQVGGRKEASIAVVDSSQVALEQQQARVYTPEDAEFHRYNELLHGFAQKIERWFRAIEVIDNSGDEYVHGYGRFAIQRGRQLVYTQSSSGTHIHPGWSEEREPDEQEIARVSSKLIVHTPNNSPRPINTIYGISFDQPDGTPVPLLDPYDNTVIGGLGLRIAAEENADGREPFYVLSVSRGSSYQYSVEYIISKQEVKIRPVKYPPLWSTDKLLTDDHTIALFDFMDTLIPGAPTPQNEQSTAPETITPPALPLPVRRPAE